MTMIELFLSGMALVATIASLVNFTVMLWLALSKDQWGERNVTAIMLTANGWVFWAMIAGWVVTALPHV